MIVLAVFCFLLLGGAIYQLAGRTRDRRRYPPIGRLIDAGTGRFHIVESGSGMPAVILEAGIAASSISWSMVQPHIAKFARVFSYDRAGLGWSDPSAASRTVQQSTGELHSLLSVAGIPAPYVLVGHSYGGLLVRAYASRFPADVAGLVLIDPVPVREWASASQAQKKLLRRGVMLSKRGALLARIGLVRFALSMLLSGGSKLPRLIAKASSGRGESVASRLVGEVSKLPPEYWPIVRAHWCDPKCFLGMSSHLERLPENAAALLQMGGLPSVPLVILSATNSTPEQIEEREALARSVPDGTHIITPHSGHWIQFDEPDLVVNAVRQVWHSHSWLC